jgi:hypothetical protein
MKDELLSACLSFLAHRSSFIVFLMADFVNLTGEAFQKWRKLDRDVDARLPCWL